MKFSHIILFACIGTIALFAVGMFAFPSFWLLRGGSGDGVPNTGYFLPPEKWPQPNPQYTFRQSISKACERERGTWVWVEGYTWPGLKHVSGALEMDFEPEPISVPRRGGAKMIVHPKLIETVMEGNNRVYRLRTNDGMIVGPSTKVVTLGRVNRESDSDGQTTCYIDFVSDVRLR